MVVAVIFYALLSILSVKVVLLQQPVEQLVLDRHLLLSREQALISVSILHLERPGVVSDVIYPVPLLWVSIKNSSDQIFALARQELRKSVLSSHNFLVQVGSLRIFKR